MEDVATNPAENRPPYVPTEEEEGWIQQAKERGAAEAAEAGLDEIKHRPWYVRIDKESGRKVYSYTVPLLEDNPYLHPRAEAVAWKDAAQAVIDRRLAN